MIVEIKGLLFLGKQGVVMSPSCMFEPHCCVGFELIIMHKIEDRGDCINESSDAAAENVSRWLLGVLNKDGLFLRVDITEGSKPVRGVLIDGKEVGQSTSPRMFACDIAAWQRYGF